MPQKFDIKLVVFAVGAFILLIFLLIVFGIIPGLKTTKTGPVLKGTITIWTIDENKQAGEFWNTTLKTFKQLYPGVTVTRREFSDWGTYENTLLDALSAGEGPDIFEIQNSALPRYANKIVPADETQFSLQSLQSQFPKIVEQDFTADGKVYGLPLSIDTLALIYNRSLIDQAAVQIPASWEAFQDVVPKLTKIQDLKITIAGAALGTSQKNIENAPDILSLLMLQNGTKMTNERFTQATFGSEEGVNALSFYTSFANPSLPTYTWNEQMPNSIDAMSQEQVAMIIDYSSALQKIKERNGFLDIGVAEVPSPQTNIDKNKKMSFAYYPGFVVSKQTKNAGVAWQFITTITTNEDIAKNYTTQTQNPPALRSLLVLLKNDAKFSVFARQALVANSWKQVDNHFISSEFSKMITEVNNQTDPEKIIKETANKISEKMRK